MKSLITLGGAIETTQEVACRPSTKSAFFWCDLKTGNIGFPTGMSVPEARPGSLMKLVTAAALLEEGIFNPNQVIDCTGLQIIEHDHFKCPKGHGRLSIEEAIAYSCNVFFARATKSVGVGVILNYARLFGLDEPVASKRGRFSDPGQAGTVRLALGLDNHLQPNALQLMRVAALIGARGKIPYLKSTETVCKSGSSKLFSLDLKEDTFQRLARGMHLVGKIGTARQLDPKGRLDLAVKTGTVAHGKKFESWIIGYFPYQTVPSYAFCLHAPVGTSHDSAVPLARKMLFSVDWP
ncbi:MAG: hypothetical protein K8F91_04950 [Candidatus Obscuribacterales bacterium]|nr:hypothetical protein [Candidatus Obscuribacterales bacterium]